MTGQLHHCWNSIQKSAAHWGLEALLTRGNIPWGQIRQCSGEYLSERTSESLLSHCWRQAVFSNHMATKIKKANSIMGSIRRTYAYLDDDSFLLLYKAQVRPHLEYANQSLAPTPKERYCCHRECTTSCHENATRNEGPNLWAATQEAETTNYLHYRRLRGDMIEMHKILNGKYDHRAADFIPLNRRETRGHT